MDEDYIFKMGKGFHSKSILLTHLLCLILNKDNKKFLDRYSN